MNYLNAKNKNCKYKSTRPKKLVKMKFSIYVYLCTFNNNAEILCSDLEEK